MNPSQRRNAPRSPHLRRSIAHILAGLVLLATVYAHADSPIALKAGATTPQTDLTSAGMTLGGSLSGPQWRPLSGIVLSPQLELFLARQHIGRAPNTEDSAYTLDFLEVPLLLRAELTLGSRSLYAIAGGYGSLLLRADETDAAGLMSPADMASRYDFGLLAGGGLSLASSRWGELSAEVRYQRGYRSLLSHSEHKNQVFSLLLGYGLGTSATDTRSPRSGDRRLTLKGGLVATRFQSPNAAGTPHAPGFAFGGAFAPARFGSWLALVPQVEFAFVHRGEHHGVMPTGALSLDDVDVSTLVRGEVAIADRAFYGLAGVYGSVLIRAQQNLNGEISPMRDAVRPLDAGWLAGAGIDFGTLGNAALSLEVRYQRGFFDRLSATEDIATQRSLSLALGITYGAPSTPPRGTADADPTALYSANDRGDTQHVTSVRIGRVGDRWLQDLQFLRIERSKRDEAYGYQVTYHIADHGDLALFWSRDNIDFSDDKSGHYRRKPMALKRGRLWYPTRITRRSLPAVHRGILQLEKVYAEQADGAIEAMEGFALVAGLGGGTPKLRRTAPSGASRGSARGSRQSSARRTKGKSPKALPAPKMVKHHIFNKFRGKSPASQKYRDFFKKHGIEVDKWTVEIPEEMHKKWIHGAGRNWTTAWKRWIDANPGATTKEVYQQAGRMMDDYGLSGLPMTPYR